MSTEKNVRMSYTRMWSNGRETTISYKNTLEHVQNHCALIERNSNMSFYDYDSTLHYRDFNPRYEIIEDE